MIDCLIQALSAQMSYLCELLFEALPKTHYSELFHWEAWREWSIQKARLELEEYDDLSQDECQIPIFRLIQETLENQTAEKLIRSLFSTCQTLESIPASITEYTRLLNEAAAIAVSKNNTELVRFFLDHIKPTSGHLASAVHNRDTEMVDLMLQQGAAPGGEIVCLKHLYDGIGLKGGECFHLGCILTTPLAEAIRWENAALINRFEEGGALDTIFDDYGVYGSEFDAAVLAAGEVGDFGYLKALINLAPPRNQMWSLAGPIVRAIHESQLLIASELITLHAKATSKTYVICGASGGISEVVCAAVGTGNLEFIDQVTEQYSFTNSQRALDMAARLGHTHVVEKLLQRGGNTSDSKHLLHGPLLEAIATHNFEMVRLLLEWGASPDYLSNAVKAGDESTVLLLLHHGADPADEKAILRAVQDDKKGIFSTIIGAFSSSYPN